MIFIIILLFVAFLAFAYCVRRVSDRTGHTQASVDSLWRQGDYMREQHRDLEKITAAKIKELETKVEELRAIVWSDSTE